MFKRNIFKILAIVFFLLAGNALFNSNKVVPVVVTKNISPSKTPIIIISPTIFRTGIARNAPTSEPIPTNIPPSEPPTNPTNSPTTPSPTSASQGLMISLNINGSSVGSMNVINGSNQCDVLSQALSQGKIQSLNMRYNNDMGTNAVYQINGIGKENAVWWVFKINGQSPGQGCSYIKANNGDDVVWEYLGN